VRIGKGNDNLRKAVEHLRSDLAKLQAETAEAEEEAKKEAKATEAINKQITELEVTTEETEQEFKQLQYNSNLKNSEFAML